MFAIQSQNSATVILGGKPYTVASDHSRFDDLTRAINDKDESAVRSIVDASTAITAVLGTFGDVQVFAGHVTFKGKPLPGANYLVGRITAFNEAGRDVEPLARFMDSVCRNPDTRAINDLFSWCEASQMPIDEQGRIIGYKIVNHDFTDCYSGRFDNSPGVTAEMLREDCDPDPSRTCSRGLHFCSVSYLPHYGPSDKKVVLVAVRPEDVTAFPTDYNLAKARACRTTTLHEIDPNTAATFFEGRDQLVYSADDYFREQYEASEAARARSEKIEAAKEDGWTVEHQDGDFIVAFDGSYDAAFDTETEAWDAVLAEIERRAAEPAPSVVEPEPNPAPVDEPAPEARFYLRVSQGYFREPNQGVTNDLDQAYAYTEETAKQAFWSSTAERVPVVDEPGVQEPAGGGLVTTADISLVGASSGELVVTNLTTTQAAPALSLGERLDRIEASLGINDRPDFAAGRLDLIEREMGITEPLSPLVARIERAERQLSL